MTDTTAPQTRSFDELSTSGLLWYINHELLHPRGYALAIEASDDESGTVGGFAILGDGSEAWSFAPEIDAVEYRARVDALMPSDLDPAQPLRARVDELEAHFDTLMGFMVKLAEVAGEQPPSTLVDGVEDLVDATITKMVSGDGA
ncbi:hypothetical protein ASD11_01355 [Aeromicrobium sp. Root495]|uniref:hypothetical protein n=1 Tax=Aeromicrobium sp. Root495 TaxID=1736550 RepID=UPI0006FF96C8|nr:hypothetical protein [Aeromicrobium sp. Root495]KQY58342.1 hypothetical protein ASD11_01355 [Aeromicrobium sp. Root495]